MAGVVLRMANRFATAFFTSIEHNVVIKGITAQEHSGTEENRVHFPAIFLYG